MAFVTLNPLKRTQWTSTDDFNIFLACRLEILDKGILVGKALLNGIPIASFMSNFWVDINKFCVASSNVIASSNLVKLELKVTLGRKIAFANFWSTLVCSLSKLWIISLWLFSKLFFINAFKIGSNCCALVNDEIPIMSKKKMLDLNLFLCFANIFKIAMQMSYLTNYFFLIYIIKPCFFS